MHWDPMWCDLGHWLGVSVSYNSEISIYHICWFLGSSCLETVRTDSQLCALTRFFPAKPSKDVEEKAWMKVLSVHPFSVLCFLDGCLSRLVHQDMFNNNTYMSSIYSIAKDQVPIVKWLTRTYSNKTISSKCVMSFHLLMCCCFHSKKM